MDRIDRLKLMLEESDNEPFIHYALASELVKIKDYEGAIERYENLVVQFPDYVGTYYHYAALLSQLDRANVAEQVYLKGMETAKRVADAHALSELEAAYKTFKGE